jgi:hypothetical protein
MSERWLSLEEREEISRDLEAGLSFRSIADGLGRTPSSVCREVNANGGRRAKYPALQADRVAQRRALQPKLARLARCGGFAASSSASSRSAGHRSRSRGGWLCSTPSVRTNTWSHETIALRPGPWCAAP